MHCELCIYIRIIDYRIYMKTFKKSLLLLAVSLFLSSVAFAQTKSLAQKADDLFNQKQYIAALEKYEEAYNKISSNKAEKNRCYFQMGECYRLMNNFPKAERVYKRLIRCRLLAGCTNTTTLSRSFIITWPRCTVLKTSLMRLTNTMPNT